MKKCLYQIIDIHEDDAYYDERKHLINCIGFIPNIFESPILTGNVAYKSGRFYPLTFFSFKEISCINENIKSRKYITLIAVKVKKLS